MTTYSSLVHVEANFTVSNVKLESGDYKTVIMAKHGESARFPISVRS